jgi:ankyrin repeat protein
MQIQNPKAVKNLLQSRPKFTINDSNAFEGSSLLTLAVSNNDEPMVRFLVTLGADLNESDGDEMTALTLAVLKNNKQMVMLLQSLGADLNKSDHNGLTPLILAVLATDESIVRLLIEKLHANIDALSTDGYTALSTALTTLNKPMFQLFNELGADLTEAENLIQLHMVSTFFGLKGKATHVDHAGKKWTISIDGFETEMTIYSLYHSVTNFLDRRQPSLKKSIRNSIVETLELATKISGWAQTSVESKDLVDRIQTGSPTFIPTGWRGHAISLVFGNEKLFVCNRGDGFSVHAIQAYACPYASVTEELISKLRETNSSKEEFFDLLKQPPLNNQPLVEEEMDMEELKADNCTWGNMKAGFLALLNVVTEKTIPDTKRRHKWCYHFYKRYTTQFRVQIAKEYLDQPLNLLSPEILSKILNKITEHKHIPIKIKQTLIRKIQKIALGV